MKSFHVEMYGKKITSLTYSNMKNIFHFFQGLKIVLKMYRVTKKCPPVWTLIAAKIVARYS